MKKNNNILITSAGRRVSLVKALQKELKAIFQNACVITADSNPEYSAACQIADFNIKVQRLSQPKYIEELVTHCLEHKIGLIVPTIDTELLLLSKNRRVFENNGIEVAISSENFINTCQDKTETASFFTKNHINTPKLIDKNKATYPIFVKPFNGSSSQGILKITQKEDLSESILQDSSLMFMEYLSPKIYSEYTVDMYYDKHNYLKCLVPRRRVEVRSGEVSKGITKKNAVYEVLQEKLAYIDGVRGCISTQVFLHNETQEIIGNEINARFGGGYPLSYYAGANFPKYLIKEYLLNEEVSYFDNWKENTLMLRYDDEIIIYDQ